MSIQRCLSRFFSNLLLYSLPQIWNKWSNIAYGVTSRGQFKRLVKSTLLLSYPTQVKKCLNRCCPDCHWELLFMTDCSMLLSCTLISPHIIVINLCCTENSLGAYLITGESQTNHDSFTVYWSPYLLRGQ